MSASSASREISTYEASPMDDGDGSETISNAGLDLPESSVSPASKRKRQARVRPVPPAPDGDLSAGGLNYACRLAFLASLDLNDPYPSEPPVSRYHHLITRVTKEFNPNCARYDNAWKLTHSWTKGWQSKYLRAFEDHLARLIIDNDYIPNLNEKARVAKFTSWYTPSKLQDLMAFASKQVDFKASAEKDSVVNSYFATLYTYILEACFAVSQNLIPREKLFSFVKSVSQEDPFKALTFRSFITYPPAPVKSRSGGKSQKVKQGSDAISSFAPVLVSTPANPIAQMGQQP